MPMFALVVAKGGVKMAEAKDTGSYTIGNGMIQATGISMDSLAQLLSQGMGHIGQPNTLYPACKSASPRRPGDYAKIKADVDQYITLNFHMTPPVTVGTHIDAG